MSEESNKCAHETCSCTTAPDSKYCSSFCEDSQGITTLMCKCGHPGCTEVSSLQSSGGSAG
jgi:hypothetical protein